MFFWMFLRNWNIFADLLLSGVAMTSKATTKYLERKEVLERFRRNITKSGRPLETTLRQ